MMGRVNCSVFCHQSLSWFKVPPKKLLSNQILPIFGHFCYFFGTVTPTSNHSFRIKTLADKNIRDGMIYIMEKKYTWLLVTAVYIKSKEGFLQVSKTFAKVHWYLLNDPFKSSFFPLFCNFLLDLRTTIHWHL